MAIAKVFRNLKKILRVPELKIEVGSEVRATYSFFVNRRSTAALSGLNTRLKEDDIVAILPVVEGG